MRWTSGDRSNIEDYRGRSPVVGGASVGLGGFLLLLILSWATGTNFLSLLNPGRTTDTTSPSAPVESSPAEERSVDFVDAVMRDVQDTWKTLLPNTYQPTRVVLFRDDIESGCRMAQSATG